MNGDKKNYFVVSRNLLNSHRWLSEKFTRGQAWVDLFGLASHTDKHLRIRGIRIDLKRGQLCYSQMSLAKRWGWSREKVRLYLNALETDQDIRQLNVQHLTTIITIVNYEKWQLKSEKNCDKLGNQLGNGLGNQPDIIKNNKNNKNKRGMFYKKTGEQIVESPKGSGRLCIWRDNECFEFADKKSQIEYR